MNLHYKKTHRLYFNTSTLNTFNFKSLSKLSFGFCGLQSASNVYVSFKQLDMVRVNISRSLKQLSRFFFRLYIRVFFTITKTKKPLLSRMGKGVGAIKN